MKSDPGDCGSAIPNENPELEDHCENDMFDFGSTKAAETAITPAKRSENEKIDLRYTAAGSSGYFGDNY